MRQRQVICKDALYLNSPINALKHPLTISNETKDLVESSLLQELFGKSYHQGTPSTGIRLS
jgi:hypothetical protein